MANEVKIAISGDAKDAEAEFKKTQSAFAKMGEGIKKNSRAIGLGLTAIGASIVGVAALAIKSSQEQQVGINRLDQALKNVGTSYEAQKKSIEAVIEAQQRKTNFGDEEQRKALVLLTGVLGDHEKALKVLPTVLDSAAFSGKDLNAVLQTMPRFFAGVSNTSIAAGISVDKLTTFEERLALVQEKVNGQAEAAADSFIQLKNRMGDLLQVVGDALLPVMERAAGLFEKVTRRVIEWAEANPGLAKVLTIVAVALGAVMLVVGPLVLILPTLITSIKLLGITARGAMGATGVGLIIVILGTLATVVLPLLIKNWDKVWNAIKRTTETVVNFVIKAVNLMSIVHRNALAAMLEAVSKFTGLLGKVIPKIGDFSDEISSAAEALRKGIPEIDMTDEAVEKLGETVEESAEVVATGFTKMGESVGAASTAVVSATLDMLETFPRIAAGASFMQDELALIFGELEINIEQTTGSITKTFSAATTDWVKTTAQFAKNVETRIGNMGEDIALSFGELETTFIGVSDAQAEAFEKMKEASEELTRKTEEDTARQQQAFDRSTQTFDAMTAKMLFNLSDQGQAWGVLGGTARQVLENMALVSGRTAEGMIAQFAALREAGESWKDLLLRLDIEGSINLEHLAGGLKALEEAAKKTGQEMQKVALPGSDPLLTGNAARVQVLQGNLSVLRAQRSDRLSRGLPVQSWDEMIAAILAELMRLGGSTSGPGPMVPGPNGGPPVPTFLNPPNSSSRVVGNGGLTLNVYVQGDVNGVDDLNDLILRTVRDNQLAGGAI